VALQLAARGRARSVVAFAPAGGWARDDESFRELLGYQAELQAQMRAFAPGAAAMLRTDVGRRRATEALVVNYEHIPEELIAHELLGIAACRSAQAMVEHGLRHDWELDFERITCPVRIVWGTQDRLLPWPAAAVRFRAELPQADWIELEGVGHAPQLDVPLLAAQLILDWP
jgi:pimeloyl-ACP methyl ester carboxylesterase